MTAVPPRPAAPDVSTDTGALREAIGREYAEFQAAPNSPEQWELDNGDDFAAGLLALPALRDLIAERDQAVAAVGRVRELGEELRRAPGNATQAAGRRIRRALDGAT